VNDAESKAEWRFLHTNGVNYWGGIATLLIESNYAIFWPHIAASTANAPRYDRFASVPMCTQFFERLKRHPNAADDTLGSIRSRSSLVSFP
jgi:hypothetical protein